MATQRRRVQRVTPEPRRCVAPIDDACERLCGEIATEEREVHGLMCPLCAEHARELDTEEDE